MIHRHLQLKLQGDPKSLCSLNTCIHVHTPIPLSTHIYIFKNNKSFFKKYIFHWILVDFVALQVEKVYKDWEDLQLRQTWVLLNLWRLWKYQTLCWSQRKTEVFTHAHNVLVPFLFQIESMSLAFKCEL